MAGKPDLQAMRSPGSHPGGEETSELTGRIPGEHCGRHELRLVDAQIARCKHATDPRDLAGHRYAIDEDLTEDRGSKLVMFVDEQQSAVGPTEPDLPLA